MLPHFPGDDHQFGFTAPVRGRGGERHDFIVVLQLLHYLPEAVADVQTDLCFDLFADSLDGVLGDDIIQAEPVGSSVLEFLFDGVVLGGTERPVKINRATSSSSSLDQFFSRLQKETFPV
ncbi:hypothetical protein [Halolamina rubra]|uniref:hypothetical protein n=1 Tax=Halolamina rubra TaxID=1380430 RepID=UPI000678EA3C|nr:hypothetical protein [Halolamina rubra]